MDRRGSRSRAGVRGDTRAGNHVWEVLMNTAYFEARFRTTKSMAGWPAEFVIISAFATTGKTWTSQENEIADRRLASELVAYDVWLHHVTGYSPATGHAEPSWAGAL